MSLMPIDKTKCCGMHTQAKEDNGECCQLEDQEKAEQDTYEHCIRPEPKEQK